MLFELLVDVKGAFEVPGGVELLEDGFRVLGITCAHLALHLVNHRSKNTKWIVDCKWTISLLDEIVAVTLSLTWRKALQAVALQEGMQMPGVAAMSLRNAEAI